MRLIFGFQPLEQIGHDHGAYIGADHAGIQLGDVQQGAQHTVDGLDGVLDLLDQGLGFGIAHPIYQIGEKQAQSMDGLAQIMAGGGEEPGFRRVGPLRFLAGRIQRFFPMFEFADIGAGQYPATVRDGDCLLYTSFLCVGTYRKSACRFI